MTWIPKNGGQGRPATAVRSASVQAKAFSATVTTLEQPIVVSVSTFHAPIYATLIAMTGEGCRVRTAAVIEDGSAVEFDIPRSSGETFTATGRVVRRSSVLIANRFEYEISFEAMTPGRAETLARYVRDLEVRAAAARSMKHAISLLPTTDDRRRTTFRAATSFAVSATILGGRSIPAAGRCADISLTGMRFLSTADIDAGSSLALDFMLPSEVLKVHSEETIAIDVRTSRVRSSSTDPRRPFAPMKIQADVVSRGTAATYEIYGLQFSAVDALQREEIARFTGAVQLQKLKMGQR